MRVGHGYDVHRVVPERPLVLGGVRISSDCGLLGHSDADVLLHAITDALLGALALGDIGAWFPDTDERYRGASSAELLKQVLEAPETRGWELVNLDATILAEHPRLAPHIAPMRESVARIFACPPARISVKATTVEGLGAIGRGEAIAAHAVMLLQRTDRQPGDSGTPGGGAHKS